MSFKEIKEMYAFVAIEDDGEEGVVAMHTGAGWMPMVGADMDRVKSLRPIAERIGKSVGKTIKLIKFSTREILEEIKP